MKKWVNDHAEDMTPEEEKAYNEAMGETVKPPPDPIEELKRTQLEQDAALMELAAMLTGGV